MLDNSAILALPPLREVIGAAKLSADKRLGQNFLMDINLTRKIARQVGQGGIILEIGPGPGGLTRALLLEHCVPVVAVEKDPRAVAALQPLVQAAAGRLTVIEGDALELDVLGFAPPPLWVAGNLPYNVGTAIVLQLFQQIHRVAGMALMFQREVAERLAAKPSTPAYGRLSVVAQALCRVEKCFDLPSSAFVPPPSIVSRVVRLIPHADAAVVPLEALATLTKAAFGQRRKMLRRSLEPLLPRLPPLEDAFLQQRAEDVTVAQYVALARKLII
ncbi:MAG: 16S rRNA (adenine(1518)-N(6)/adenine(1519)-N(6))-dimethyltransferase RsmA [Holosporales bacterium]